MPTNPALQRSRLRLAAECLSFGRHDQLMVAGGLMQDRCFGDIGDFAKFGLLC
jgi:hypothetical protein